MAPPPDERAAQETTPTETKPKGDPIRRITKVVLWVCVIIFVITVFADRMTPYTQQARVQALVIPLVPRVSGYLTEVKVRLHSVVDAGDLLFEIDPRPYELAVQAAEAKLDQVAQQVGAQAATVKSATAQLAVARSQLDRAQRNYNRTKSILSTNPGALSQADRDRAETALDQALARVAAAEANLHKAQERLGVEGSDNAQLRAATAALEQAQLNLSFTSLYAPDRGAIESFNVDIGYSAQAGQPLATLVSHREVWIEADMRENQLGRIQIGDPVEFVLDAVPGRVFHGSVRSVGFGVNAGGKMQRGELPTIRERTGWLRDPQRFPVIVELDAPGEAAGMLRAGGQVDVIVYTGRHPLLNLLGRIHIRLKSILSYVR